MMQINKHYSRSEKLLLLLFFLASFLSLIFFFKYKSLAFPEDNIHFSITNNQATKNATTFLSDLGIDPTGYKHTTVFDIDDPAKTYIEREESRENVTKLTQNTIDVWDFNTRFFKPLQQEEFSVSYLPNGRLVSYTRIVEDNKPVATLT